jgi:hypothetical protein
MQTAVVQRIKSVIICILFWCGLLSGYAQDYFSKDSIEQLHQKVQQFKSISLNDSVLYYNTVLNQKYKWNYTKSLKANNDTMLVMYGVPYVGRLQNHIKDLPLAIQIGNDVLPIAKKHKDTLALVDLYIDLGQSYYGINDYLQSVLYLNEAMHVIDTTTLKKEAFDLYYQLGKSTFHFDKSQALSYYYNAERYIDHVSDTKKYIFYARMTAILPNFPLEHVLRYFELEKKYSKIETNKTQAISYYNNLAYAYFENGKVEKAKDVLEQHLSWCRLDNDFGGFEKREIYHFIDTYGVIENALGHHKSALKCFELALELAKEKRKFEHVILLSNRIARLCEKTKQYKKGFEALVPMHAYLDSLTTKDLGKEVKKEQSKRLLEREKVTVEKLTKANAKINIKVSRLTIALYLLALVIGGVIFFNILTQLKQVKIKETLNLNQLQNLTAAMNPHFLFNSFSSLQNLILKTDTAEANTYMANLARLIRHFFYAFEHINIPFQKEIETLESYCKLEALRQGEDFVYEINVDKTLEEEVFLIPSMLIQPIVENAFKHAFIENDEYHLRIDFKAIKAGDYIKCTVTDNGVGREAAERIKQASKHLSISSRNMDMRFKIIQKQLKKKAQMRITDLKTKDGRAKGTEVVLILPKMY